MEATVMKPSNALILAFTTAFVSVVGAQQVVFPAKGQTPDQQKKDEAACYSWAAKESGYDPANPPAAAAAPPPPTTASGSTPGAGARGAARGAIVGEAVNGDASSGAAVGAVAARGASRRANANQAQQGQQQAAAGNQQGQAQFGKARAACLEGKGYTVK